MAKVSLYVGERPVCGFATTLLESFLSARKEADLIEMVVRTSNSVEIFGDMVAELVSTE